MSIRCRIGWHDWSLKGPWHGLRASERLCLRCGLHQVAWPGSLSGWAPSDEVAVWREKSRAAWAAAEVTEGAPLPRPSPDIMPPLPAGGSVISPPKPRTNWTPTERRSGVIVRKTRGGPPSKPPPPPRSSR